MQDLGVMCKALGLKMQYMRYFVCFHLFGFDLTDFSMLGKRLGPDNLQSSATATSTPVQRDKRPHSPDLPHGDELLARNRDMCKSELLDH